MSFSILAATLFAAQPVSATPPPPAPAAVNTIADGLRALERGPLAPAPPPSGRAAGQPARSIGPLSRLFSYQDYPREALRTEQQGLVNFRLTIGTNGRVTGCDIVASSGSASLDSATCAILQRRARFDPARDGRGRATTGHYVGRIKWAMPALDPIAVADSQQRTIFQIDRKGKVGACWFERDGVVSALPYFCTALTDAARKLVASAPKSIALAGSQLVYEIAYEVGRREWTPATNEPGLVRILSRDEVRLTIDAAGKVVDCEVRTYPALTSSTEALCAAERRAAYVPLGAEVTNRGNRYLSHIFTRALRRP